MKRLLGLEVVDWLRRKRELEGVGLYDIGSAGTDTEQVGVGDDTKGLVVVEDGALVVPFGFGEIDDGSELWWDGEGGLEDVGVLPGKSNADLGSRSLVLSS